MIRKDVAMMTRFPIIVSRQIDKQRKPKINVHTIVMFFSQLEMPLASCLLQANPETGCTVYPLFVNPPPVLLARSH